MHSGDGTIDLRAALQDLATSKIGRPLEILETVDSTNSLLVQRARAGAPAGMVLLADQQLAGRGRHGRSWSSQAGSSLLCSILLRPAWLTPARAFGLTIISALAAAEAIEEVSGLAAGLKWPNDIQAGPRKLGGILVEAECRQSELVWAVIGCGINVNWDPTTIPELRERASSLQRELGQPVDRGALARALLETLDRRYEDLRAGHDDRLLELWRSRLITLGQRVQIEEPDGTLSGVAMDVEADGALVVRDDLGFYRRVLSATGLTWLE